LEIEMSIGSENASPTLENLSALADGEVDASAAAHACAAWRDDPSARSAWRSYHLIGDVLRSEDLAIAHDVSLLAALRTRLADEPVVLAPQAARPPAHGARSIRWTWVAPSAVAAGFVLVAGALMVTRQPSAGDAGAVTASTAFDGSATRDAAAFDSTLQPRASAADLRLLRDARLDRYLAAHQQFAGSTALGVPSGFLRNAAVEAPNR
jgi:sigma-E factor negative regulatory protein RseA